MAWSEVVDGKIIKETKTLCKRVILVIVIGVSFLMHPQMHCTIPMVGIVHRMHD